MTEGNLPNLEQDQSREMRSLTGMLIVDFRNSYRYSQSNPVLQHVIMTLLRDQYMEAGGDRVTNIPSALLIVGAHIGNFVLPPHHKPIKSGVQEDFQEAFSVFKKCLTEPDYMPTRTVYSGYSPSEQPFPSEREERLKILIEVTAKQDDFYLRMSPEWYARGGRPQGADPYMSYLREYVLGGAETHSDACNAMFSGARNVLIAAHPNTELAWHKPMWENRHPGEEYYPKLFVEGLEAVASSGSAS